MKKPDSYPEAQRGNVCDDFFGTKVSDPYRWLEDDAPERTNWVEAQSTLTRNFIDSNSDLRGKLFDTMRDGYNYPKRSPPFREGSRAFYFDNPGLLNQRVLMKQDDVDSPTADVLLDPNTMSEDGTASLSTLSVSKSGKFLAYGISHGGSDWITVSVRAVETTKDLEDTIQWVKFSGVEWTHDELGFFYCCYDAPEEKTESKGTEKELLKTHKMYYHYLGTSQADDILIYARDDKPNWVLGVEVTDDGKYCLITTHDGCAHENCVYYFSLENKSMKNVSQKDILPLYSEPVASFHYVTNDDDVLYFVTSLDAPRRRVVSVKLSDPKNVTEIIPEDPNGGKLKSVQCVANEILATIYMVDVADRIRMFSLKTGNHLFDVELPTVGCVGGIYGRREDMEIFFNFTSFCQPSDVYRLNLSAVDPSAGSQTAVSSAPFWTTSVPGFDSSLFQVQQKFYESKDGTKIPMFVVNRKGTPQDGTQPTLLYGYGGFNVSIQPYFSSFRTPFLKQLRGTFVVANLRGGGEYGKDWHDAGKLGRKQNVFDDFHAAAEYLIREKYTCPEKLAIMGGSNGGLLVATCVNQRPDLYAAGVAACGVMDMLRFHRFTIGKAWVSDYGCSEDDEASFQNLYRYSPLHNVRSDVAYPAMLLTTADHDDRVVPLHTYKLLAELQHTVGRDLSKGQPKPILARIELKAGHGAGKPTTKIIEEQSDIYAFLGLALNMTWTDE